MKNITFDNAIMVATVFGSSILIVNSAMGLMKVASPKGAIMPVISILVGFAAFKYAIAKQTVVSITK